jgi:23S rRNA (pseudouridine1915-N3)-methyltransferase
MELKSVDSGRQLSFLVGGFLGLAPRIMEKADLRLSLSRMTFSHELARTVLLEQVYRALNLIKGYAYPK